MNTDEKQFKLIAWLLVLVNTTGIALNYMVSALTFFVMGIGLPILLSLFLYLSWAIHKPAATWRTRVFCIVLIIYYSIISLLGISLGGGEWFTEIDLSGGICMPGIFPLLNIILLAVLRLKLNTQLKVYEEQIN